MPILSKCCCCSLQAGVITIGILGLIFPTIMTGAMIWVITTLGVLTHASNKAQSDYKTKMTELTKITNSYGLNFRDDPEIANDMDNYDKNAEKANFFVGLGWGVCVAIVVVLILLIIMNILLIVGACKDKAKLLLPWLGYTLLSILANVIGMIALFVVKTGFSIPLLLECIIYGGVSMLIWLCVFSLYQEITERRQNQSYQQPMQKM